ncbi:MAG: hypothetical protein ACOYNH_07130 [Bacteroidia bacterium]
MENNNLLLAKKVVDTMLEKDWFSQWLGIEIVELKPGYVKLKIKIKKEMFMAESITLLQIVLWPLHLILTG